MSRIGKFIETKIRLMVAMAWGRRGVGGIGGLLEVTEMLWN